MSINTDSGQLQSGSKGRLPRASPCEIHHTAVTTQCILQGNTHSPRTEPTVLVHPCVGLVRLYPATRVRVGSKPPCVCTYVGNTPCEMRHMYSVRISPGGVSIHPHTPCKIRHMHSLCILQGGLGKYKKKRLRLDIVINYSVKILLSKFERVQGRVCVCTYSFPA